MGLLKAEITDELRAKRRIWDKNRRLRNKFNLTPDRKAKERGVTVASDEAKIQQWMARLRKRGTNCYYCQTQIIGGQINFDHIFAIGRSGPHCIENLCAACKSCNSRKHVKTITEWQKPNQQVFAV